MGQLTPQQKKIMTSVAIIDLVIAIGLFIYILAFGSNLSLAVPLLLVVGAMAIIVVAQKL
jgi:hypothetical protein